jgi:D-3-phosphoglycerate dehydrogenase
VVSKKLQVVYVDAYDDVFVSEEREELAKVQAELTLAQCRTEEDFITACKDAEAILSFYFPITRKLIGQIPHCKVMARYGVGVDNIDVDAATEAGIVVANVPDYCFEEVSNHTMALLLGCVRKLVYLDQRIRQGHWDRFPAPTQSLYDQTLGLIGCGNIARMVAVKARCFGLKVIGYDPYLPPKVAQDAGITLMNLDDVIKQSDFISVHAALTDETRHMVSDREFGMMKPSAFIVNVARGPLIDEKALIKALKEKKIAGAGLDVHEKEPLDRDDPLLTLDNVILTPHTAYYSEASFSKLRRGVGNAAARVLTGYWPKSAVNRAKVKPRAALKDMP